MRFLFENTVADVSSLRREHMPKMADIEDRLFDPWLANDEDDLWEDLQNKSIVGTILKKEENLLGYIYGYTGAKEELDSLNYAISNSSYDFVFYPDSRQFVKDGDMRKFAEFIKKIVKGREVLYVANFAVLPDGRYYVKKLLSSFLEKVRSKNYKWMAFDALDDTQKLIFDGNGGLKEDRLKSLGIIPIASFPTDYSRLFMFKI